MENKKGSLSKVFLVIAIILIIVMGALLYMQKKEADRQIVELKNNAIKLQETINDLEKQIDNSSNTINNIGVKKSNDNIFMQFNTKFYDLSDIAKDYIDYKNIKNHKEFNYDLDGDGIIDNIIVSQNAEMVNNGVGGNYEISSYSAKLYGEIFSEGSTMDSIYIVDLNEDDKNLEIIVFDDGPSDDPNYTIYAKSENKMIEIKNIGGYPLKTDKKGTVLVEYVYSRAIVPEIYFEYYIIRDGKMEVKNVDIEKIKDIELKTSSLYFSTDYENVNKIFGEFSPEANTIEEKLKILNIEKLKENITFKIKEFAIEENFGYDGYGYKIQVELSDGREGYVFYIQMAG